MTLRADHVAGATFVGFGLLVIALSGDLPMGSLSLPGSGFMPKLVASLTIVLGIALFARGAESEPFSSLKWEDGTHAGQVILITAAAIAVYTRLGFMITIVALMLGLLVIIERRNVVHATIYSMAVAVLTYGVFEYVLKTPLPNGPFGF